MIFWFEHSCPSSSHGTCGLATSRKPTLNELRGDHKVLDSSGQPFRSGEDPSDCEDATHDDALRGFVMDLASHGPWDGDIKKEKKRFDSVRHRISKTHRVCTRRDNISNLMTIHVDNL
jgi:hypothetical protein